MASKLFDRENELLPSSKDVLSPRKDARPSERLDTYLLQRKSPQDKRLIEKPKYFFRGPEEIVGSKEGQHPCGRSSSLHKQESISNSAKQGKANPKEQS
ncbi:hypothetical protein O181_086193 [Austropuccinia psidii MF-1]|uniref:Uncharacterized protein n=1 Tax=Austropuccinia psidii MF-1 TaxID=1389203 RepID=A0A9Q3FYV6_9BASI|nr:hypothetical protein [Austropuccinia psidii MF-1]